jgi:hypothetical protein
MRNILLFVILSATLGTLHAQPSDTLLPNTQQVIELNDAAPSVRYPFQSDADAVWSFSAVTLSGDLDPVLRLFDPAGNQLLANDNETRVSRDARLENWIAPAAGTYTLEIAREGDARATTSGSLLLTVLGDANSLPLSPLPIPPEVPLRAGAVWEFISFFDLDHVPIHLEFTAEFTPEDAFGLQMVGAEGERWLLVMSVEGATLQQRQIDPETNTPRQVILLDDDTPLDQGMYTISLENRRLEVWLAGESILSMDAAPDFSFLQGVSLRLVAMPNNTGQVIFRQPYASAPFYPDGDASAALPPALPNQRLYQYADIPLRAVAELRELGYLEAGGGLAFTVPDGLIETSAAGFSTFPLEMAMSFQDFALHFDATVRIGDPSAACGMSIRQVDSANFTSVLFSANGNAYILPYQAGVLAEDNLALQTPWINPGIGVSNDVLLIAQGEQAQLFINGVLINSQPIPIQSGKLQMTAVVNVPQITRCTYSNIWLWSLD